jgi:hypothetical protein
MAVGIIYYHGLLPLPSYEYKSLCLPLACASSYSALNMESVCISETSANLYQATWCNIPEDSYFVRTIALKSKLTLYVCLRKHALGMRKYVSHTVNDYKIIFKAI